MKFQFRLFMYLALVSVGFYFGRYAGAVTLPLIFFTFFNAPKNRFKINKNEKNRINQKNNENKKNIDWAYQALNISPQNTMEFIIKARKKCLNESHPDKLSLTANEDEKQRSCARINLINRAFDAISQERKNEQQ